MQPVNFKGADVVFSAPGCEDLPAFRNVDGWHVSIETHWMPNDQERAAIAAGGAIVLTVIGTNPQPCRLDVAIPEGET